MGCNKDTSLDSEPADTTVRTAELLSWIRDDAIWNESRRPSENTGPLHQGT